MNSTATELEVAIFATSTRSIGKLRPSTRNTYDIAADFVTTIRKSMALIKKIATGDATRRRVDQEVGDFRAKPAFIPP